MPHLYPHLRVHQVFGANTDVGKTLLTTALSLAAASGTPTIPPKKVYYLKPVSTGPPSDSDAEHVALFSSLSPSTTTTISPSPLPIRTDTLYRFKTPVSPHLAAEREGAAGSVPSDAEFVRAVGGWIEDCAREGEEGWAFVESAGGVHSPTLSGTTQVDAYRPLRLPTILIASPHLGGISTTLSSYESLLLRGYPIPALLIFSSPFYSNETYLARWARSLPQSPLTPPPHIGIVPPPPTSAHPKGSPEDEKAMREWYDFVVQERGVRGTLEALEERWEGRRREVEGAGERTVRSVWYPFVQHSSVKGGGDVTVVDSAYGDFFDTYKSNSPVSSASASSTPTPAPAATQSLLTPTLDGSASWWTQALGHASPSLTLSAAHAAGRYGHVLFPLHTHAPALELAERLLGRHSPKAGEAGKGVGSGWAGKVFFSDNGSTGIEVALKMALRAVARRYGDEGGERGVLGLAGSYHGDTIGSMDASEPSTYNASVEWYRPRGGYWFPPPSLTLRGGKPVVALPSECPGGGREVELPDGLQGAYDVERRLREDPLRGVYERWVRGTLERLCGEGRRFGALVLEPALMGAGGMIWVDPLFQRVLIDVVRSSAQLFSPSTSPPSPSTSPGTPTWSGLPIIFDEVFVGLHRLGHLSPSSSLLRASPDIAVYAKILTGGLLPLSATLASDAIYDVFRGSKKEHALLHGHSYTAHPVGCAVACRALEELEGMGWEGERADWGLGEGQEGVWSLWGREWVERVSKMERVVEGVMAMGSVLVLKLRAGSKGYESSAAQSFLERLREPPSTSGEEDFAIHSRPLGDVVYFMSSLNTPVEVRRNVERRIEELLRWLESEGEGEA